MFPTICQIGPLTIHAYGLMLAISIIVSSYLMSREAHRIGVTREWVYDFVFWIVVYGIIGARLFFIILNFSYFKEHIVEIIMIHHGGLSWQGGLMAGTLGGILILKRTQVSVLVGADLLAPYLALGQSIGRIGCFLNGCCYGREASWGIYFPAHDMQLIPTQLFSTLGLFVIFILLKRLRKVTSLPGELFGWYLVLASSLRFVIEFFRGDHYTTFLHLSIYQYICLGILSAAVIFRLNLKK